MEIAEFESIIFTVLAQNRRFSFIFHSFLSDSPLPSNLQYPSLFPLHIL